MREREPVCAYLCVCERKGEGSTENTCLHVYRKTTEEYKRLTMKTFYEKKKKREKNPKNTKADMTADGSTHR